MNLGNLWIWPEANIVRWFTPIDTGLLDISLPNKLSVNISELREKQEKTFFSVLEPKFYAVIKQYLQKYPNGLCLHLTEDLPDEWQKLPFEWLHLEEGGNLQGRLIVERFAPRLAIPPNFPSSSKLAIVNLLPDTDARAFKGLASQFEQVQIYKSKGVFKKKNLSSFSMLCLIVHGSEQDNAKPFRLKNGELWDLPSQLSLSLPPLVLLLVCGSDSGNLIDYGKTLLQLGAQTVLASVGQLDAQPSAKFLTAFLKKWLYGQRVDEILLKAQGEPNSETAAQRLQLLGRGELRISSQYAENQDELSFMVNRITLRCFQDDGNLYKAVDELRQFLNIPYGDAQEKKLLTQLDELKIWELSRSWVLPLLVYLAEQYDHKLLKKYELERSKLNKHHQALSPAIYHYWAKLYYRNGRYNLAVKETVEGLCLVTPENLYSLGEGLLGNLINLLIDFNLAKEGTLLYDTLDEDLVKQQTEKAKIDHHKLLDRAARLALKQNHSYKAISKYKIKREESIELYNETGERELAWLLYVTAFLKYKQAHDYAEEVKSILANENQIRENLNKNKGNANELYLIRALSLWAWRANDSEAVKLLERYKDILCNHSTLRDTGPLNFSIIYLYLYFRESPNSKFELPPLEEVFDKLEQYRYWFELAALGSLLNVPERQTWLRKFQRQRQGTLSDLEKLPLWLRTDGQDWNWEESIKQQNQKELEVLLGETAPSVEQLIEAGLLPL